MGQYLVKSEKTGRVCLISKTRWFGPDIVILRIEEQCTWECSQFFDQSVTHRWRDATRDEMIDLAYAGAKLSGRANSGTFSSDPKKSESNDVCTCGANRTS